MKLGKSACHPLKFKCFKRIGKKTKVFVLRLQIISYLVFFMAYYNTSHAHLFRVLVFTTGMFQSSLFPLSFGYKRKPFCGKYEHIYIFELQSRMKMKCGIITVS